MRLLFEVIACSAGSDCLNNTFLDPISPTTNSLIFPNTCPSPIEIILQLPSLYTIQSLTLGVALTPNEAYSHYNQIKVAKNPPQSYVINLNFTARFVKLTIEPKNPCILFHIGIQGVISTNWVNTPVQPRDIDLLLMSLGLVKEREHYMDKVMRSYKDHEDYEIMNNMKADKITYDHVFDEIQELRQKMKISELEENYDNCLKIQNLIELRNVELRRIQALWKVKYQDLPVEGDFNQRLEAKIQNRLQEKLDGTEDKFGFGAIFGESWSNDEIHDQIITIIEELIFEIDASNEKTQILDLIKSVYQDGMYIQEANDLLCKLVSIDGFEIIEKERLYNLTDTQIGIIETGQINIGIISSKALEKIFSNPKNDIDDLSRVKKQSQRIYVGLDKDSDEINILKIQLLNNLYKYSVAINQDDLAKYFLNLDPKKNKDYKEALQILKDSNEKYLLQNQNTEQKKNLEQNEQLKVVTKISDQQMDEIPLNNKKYQKNSENNIEGQNQKKKSQTIETDKKDVKQENQKQQNTTKQKEEQKEEGGGCYIF